MKKNKGFVIAIAILAVCVITESVLLIVGTFTKVPKTSNGEDIVVSLNDGTNYTANELYSKLKSQYGLSEILDAIDSKILSKEYEIYKDEVEAYVNDAKVNLRANYESDEKMEEALQNYGYNSVDDYLAQVRDSKYKTYATNDYAKSLVTEEEIKKYYDEKIYADIEGVHILVKPASSSTKDQDAAKKKAEDVIKAIKADVKKGTKVDEAFKKYEKDSSVTYQNLGRYNYSQMDEAFSKAAYALKINEVSDAVKSSFGYHVILKTKEYEKDSLELERSSIINKLSEEKTKSDTSLQTKALMNIRNKYGIKINDSELQKYYERYINRQVNQ